MTEIAAADKLICAHCADERGLWWPDEPDTLFTYAFCEACGRLTMLAKESAWSERPEGKANA